MNQIWNLRVSFFILIGSCWFLFVSCSFLFTNSNPLGNRRGISSALEDHSNFIVDEIKGQVLATRLNGVPEEVKISYKACFREVFQTENPLPNTLFKVHLFESGHSADNSKKVGNPQTVNQDNQKKSSSADLCRESSEFVFSDKTKPSCLKLRTDANGCLTWAEFYSFPAINQSVWFGYQRAFEGTGIYAGKTVVNLAVNPLLSIFSMSSDMSLVDLRYHSEYQKRNFVRLSKKNSQICSNCIHQPASLSAVVDYFSKTQNRLPRLWLNEVYVNVSQELFPLTQSSKSQQKLLQDFKVCVPHSKSSCKDPPGRFFKVQLEMPLKIRIKDHRGASKLVALTHGKYLVKPYLFLQSDRGENWSLHRDVQSVSADLIQGSDQTTLRADFYLHVPYERYGIPILLGLKVQPSGGSHASNFLTFEGVFSFPDHLSSVIGSQTLKLDHKTIAFYKNSNSALGSFIDTYQLSMDPRKNRGRKGFRKASWDIELRRFRFSDISLEEGKCPTPVGRYVRYVGEICIVDPLTRKTIPNTSIVIKRSEVNFDKAGQVLLGPATEINKIAEDDRFDRESFSIKGQRENLSGEKEGSTLFYNSDATGCLRWMDNLYHTWYDRERYFVRKMIFSIPELGFEGEKMIAINPWHWGFVFFQDITQLGSSSVRVNPQRAERPRLVLHDFRSMFVNPVYAIDRLLGINIFQNLLFLFRTRIDRPGNITTGFGGQRPSSMDIRRGYYWLRFILVKAHTEEQGGQGNLVVKTEDYIKNHYTQSSNFNWNDHVAGWVLDRNGHQTGQMMNTRLEYITHFDTYTQIRDSTVNAYINFIFNLDQFIFIGSNNRVIVQLLPTNPKYYVYREGTCEINPSRTQFMPFTQHELITRPFMGTFVPGDRRNWNIFRVLSTDSHSQLSNNFLENQLLALDMKHTNSLINYGKKHSKEHKLFLKLQSLLNIKTQNWSETPLLAVKDGINILEQLYQYMGKFSQSTIDSDQLVEVIHQTNQFLTKALSGSHLHQRVSTFLSQISILLKNLLPKLLESQKITNSNLKKSNSDLKKQVAQIRKELTNLINQQLAHPELEDSLKSFTLQNSKPPEQNKTEDAWVFHSLTDSYKNQKLKPWTKKIDSSSETDPSFLSGANMNHFAYNEGLKVIAMDNHKVAQNFISDLNHLSNKYNTQYSSFLDVSSGKPFNEQVAQSIIELRENQAENPSSETQWWESFKQKNKEIRNNFPLEDKDNYVSFVRKNKQMYLPPFSSEWLRTVLTDGVHAGTIDTPEVMTFLHSMCFFWFEKFYDEYLEQDQIDVLRLKHIEYYDYYKSTLEYLRSESHMDQYKKLLQLQHEYFLEDLSENFVKKENPFFVYPSDLIGWKLVKRIQNAISGFFTNQKESIQQKKSIQQTKVNVVESLYGKIREQYDREMAGLPLMSHLINPMNIYNRIEGKHPFFKCVANPLNFFHLESKVIVGDISSRYEDLTYEYGQTRSLNVQTSYDWAYGVNWAMSVGFSGSTGTGVAVLGGLGDWIPFKWVNSLFTFAGIRGDVAWNTTRSDAESSRRQMSLRVARTLYLTLNHSVFSIGLSHFRRCLVIRPKNLAFEGYSEDDQIWKKKWANNFMRQILFIKSGLLICSENIHVGENDPPERILEDYFYIYQPSPGDQGQFQNPLNFRNRPYVITVRGITELEKLEFLFHSFVEPNQTPGVEDYNPERPMTNLFYRHPKMMDGMRRAVKQAKVWDKTGFYPGVYNVKYSEDHHYFRDPKHQAKGVLEKFGDWLTNNNPLNLIRMGTDEQPILDKPSRQ